MSLPTVLIPGLLCSPRLYAEQLPTLWRAGPVMVADHTRDDSMAGIAARIQRPAGAAMAVVVHHQGVADGLGVQPRAGRPERTEADREVEQPLGPRPDRGEDGKTGRRPRAGDAGAAAEAAEPEGGRGRQQAPTIQGWAHDDLLAELDPA